MSASPIGAGTVRACVQGADAARAGKPVTAAQVDASGVVLRKLRKALDDPSYNFMLHTTPFHQGPQPHYHWHIEILPMLTNVAGFEWGSGFHINPTPPEKAAEFLRLTDIEF